MRKICSEPITGDQRRPL